MRRFLAAALVAVAGHVSAQSSCPAHEYAQYKDQAKSELDRMSLAMEYCRVNANIARLSDGPKRDQCRSEMDKISQVLTQARDFRGLEYARGGCSGDYPWAAKK